LQMFNFIGDKINDALHTGQVGNRLFTYLEQRGGCQNGMLWWNEFVPFLSQVGWSFPAAQQAWWQADTNRSGSLSRSEFIRFCSFPNVRGYIQQIEATLTGATGSGMPGVNIPATGGYMAPRYGMGVGAPMMGAPMMGGPMMGGPMMGGPMMGAPMMGAPMMGGMMAPGVVVEEPVMMGPMGGVVMEPVVMGGVGYMGGGIY